MSTTRGRPASLNAFLNARSAVIGLCRVAFLGLQHAAAAPLTTLGHGGGIDEPEAEGPGLYVLYALSAILVVAGGAFAGLTIAFMGQDGIYLKVLKDDIHESASLRRAAEKVLNLLNRGKHWVLVTLLLANVIVNESLPVVLDRCLGGGVAAIVGSTVLIVIFGEVVPQSVCVRYGLPIGGFMAFPVLALMWLTAPISWPIAKLLDYILGTHEGTVYKKSGLKTLVTLHQTMGEVSERLNTDEVTIIRAVLDLKGKPVGRIMTPMSDVFTLSADAVLDEQLMDSILSAGYSRIPVHQPNNPTNFVGMLLVKILITYDPEDCMQVKDFPLAALPETRPETSCLDILNYFQDGKSHMAMVSSAPGQDHGALGVVTLEDVIEELIGEEIIDESDVYIDVHKAIRRLTPAPTTMLFRRGSLNADKLAKEHGRGEGARPIETKRLDPSTAGQDEVLVASPKTVTFMMKKRHSAGPDGFESSNVPVKANMDELRQHLKHLGPSNPASNPKNTNSATVMIKPGFSGLSPASAAQVKDVPRGTTLAIVQTPEDDVEGSDEDTPLLASKMTPRENNGIFVSKPSYGTADPSNGNGKASLGRTSQPLSLESDGSATITPADDGVAAGSPRRQASPPESPKPGKSRSSTITSPVTTDGASDLFSAPARATTSRSGPIMESYIESGGVRKVVITASSGDEEEDTVAGIGIISSEAPPAPSIESAPAALETEESGETQTTNDDPAESEEAEEEESQPLLDVGSPNTQGSSSTAGQAGNVGSSGGGGGKKNKKKRKGKKK